MNSNRDGGGGVGRVVVITCSVLALLVATAALLVSMAAFARIVTAGASTAASPAPSPANPLLPAGTTAPTARDEHLNTYIVSASSRYVPVGAVRTMASIHPGETVSDLLVFERPVSAATTLYITLPGLAFEEARETLEVETPIRWPEDGWRDAAARLQDPPPATEGADPTPPAVDPATVERVVVQLKAQREPALRRVLEILGKFDEAERACRDARIVKKLDTPQALLASGLAFPSEYERELALRRLEDRRRPLSALSVRLAGQNARWVERFDLLRHEERYEPGTVGMFGSDPLSPAEVVGRRYTIAPVAGTNLAVVRVTGDVYPVDQSEASLTAIERPLGAPVARSVTFVIVDVHKGVAIDGSTWDPAGALYEALGPDDWPHEGPPCEFVFRCLGALPGVESE